MATTIPLIISVDDHVVEPPHLWETWLPGKYRADGPRVIRAPWELNKVPRSGDHPKQGMFRIGASGPETDFWVYENLSVATVPTLAAIGLSDERMNDTPLDYAEIRPGCFDPQARLADMDVNHVERSLCFPTFPRFCGQTFLEAKDKELAMACVVAYNDWMVEEWCGDSGGRLIPLCLIPLWDVEAAAAEVVRNAKRGVRALAFSEMPDALGLPAIYDLDAWAPLLRACEDTGTAICMHVGSSSDPVMRPHRVASHALSHVTAEIALVDWFYSGALPRFPRLKLAFSESQVGWMTFALQRLDCTWRKQKDRKFSKFSSEIAEEPSSYAGDRVYACAFEDDYGIATRGGKLGIDNLTFETDYPHSDSTWPDTLAYVERAFADYDDDELHKVMRGNAMRMLDLH